MELIQKELNHMIINILKEMIINLKLILISILIEILGPVEFNQEIQENFKIIKKIIQIYNYLVCIWELPQEKIKFQIEKKDILKIIPV